MSFTFLFITKGRNEFEKSLTKCIEQSKKLKSIKIVIIDGNEDDRVKNFLKINNYIENIKIVKQKKGKFVRACLIAIDNLETDYFTFMHDDDFISPYFYKLINFAVKNQTSVIGNGIVIPKNNDEFLFSKIDNLNKINSKNLLNNYFCSKKISNKFLPANPACSVFKKEVAYIWISVIKEIVKDRFLSYYFFYKNIGQDLLLYLISLSIQKDIFYYENYTCQFSSHEDSMSVNFGSNNLGVGYWLAKKVYTRFEGNLFQHKTTMLEQLNLFLRGILYCVKQGSNNQKFYFHSTKKLLEQIFNYKKIEINNI